MKQRPSTTTSERELLLALINSGRSVSLKNVVDWRKDGLLPPFATTGRGQGKGKSYYWLQDDIIPRACFVHDLIQRYSRIENVTFVLWLSGFEVDLLKFRRAWLHKIRMRPASNVRPRVSENCSIDYHVAWPAVRANEPAAVLLNVILTMCDVLKREEASDFDNLNSVILGVCGKLGFADVTTADCSGPLRNRVIRLFLATCSFLESTNLVSKAPDAELILAQKYLASAGKFLQICLATEPNTLSDNEIAPFWSATLAKNVAAPLLVMILALFHAGYAGELELTDAEVRRLTLYWLEKSGHNGRESKRAAARDKAAGSEFVQKMRQIWRRAC